MTTTHTSNQPHAPMMPSPGAAVDALIGNLTPVGAEQVPLAEAARRVLAERVVSDRASPAVDVSAMDGYAVRLGDVAEGPIAVCGEVTIGRQPPELRPGCAMQIVTGGGIPAGADTVLKREDVEERGESIKVDPALLARRTLGEHIRRCGENIGKGEVVLDKGQYVSAPAAGTLAAFGVAEPRVYKRVRVGYLATGDELRSVDDEPTPWSIRDSSKYSIEAFLGELGYAQLVDVRHERDDLDGLTRAAGELLERCDVLLTTGGVSMGQRDFVPRALAGAGARTVFHKIAQRPGKPMLGAIGPTGQAICALPGNPVSVLVTARRIVAPVLGYLAGMRIARRADASMELTDADDATCDRWWYRLVRAVGAGKAELVSGRGSGDMVCAARSDGFVETPPGQGGCGPWDYYPWQALSTVT